MEPAYNPLSYIHVLISSLSQCLIDVGHNNIDYMWALSKYTSLDLQTFSKYIHSIRRGRDRDPISIEIVQYNHKCNSLQFRVYSFAWPPENFFNYSSILLFCFAFGFCFCFCFAFILEPYANIEISFYMGCALCCCCCWYRLS